MWLTEDNATNKQILLLFAHEPMNVKLRNCWCMHQHWAIANLIEFKSFIVPLVYDSITAVLLRYSIDNICNVRFVRNVKIKIALYAVHDFSAFSHSNSIQLWIGRSSFVVHILISNASQWQFCTILLYLKLLTICHVIFPQYYFNCIINDDGVDFDDFSGFPYPVIGMAGIRSMRQCRNIIGHFQCFIEI